MLPSQREASYSTLLRNSSFLRLFLAQFVSSLGDWIGVIAIAVLARRIGGDAAVGAVLTARVLPGFVAGPIAGVIADRWDRKKSMVIADIMRAVIIFSLPLFPHLLYLLLASMLLEVLTLVWGPAKDAALPHFVKAEELPHANSLNLIAVYGPWPLSSIVYASLSALGAFLAGSVPALEGLHNNEEALALWLDSLTFVFSAVMVSGLAIVSSRRREGRLELAEIKRDLVEGLVFVRDHKQVRPWLLAIAATFTAAGGVFSLGVGFVKDVLGGGDRGFAFLIGFLASGMLLGLYATARLVRKMHKDVLLSAALLLLGGSLIGLASMSTLTSAIPVATALGFFGGVAYSTAYSLVYETTSDELRGRTFSAGYTVIRIGVLIGLGIFPFVAGAVGSHTLRLPFGTLDLSGTRVALWAAGVVVMVGGILSARAIGAREPSPAGLPGRRRGYFVVFEGGEGAGKTTQIQAFAGWLRARGEDVVTTLEPGATEIGRRIRDIVLDPANSNMDPRTETLLYAADRAQHVAEVIAPALEEGKIVVSDRFVDSSLAYQGGGRELGLEDVYRISGWSTGGLLPDLVFFLRVDPKEGLQRSGGDADRIEQEGGDFHARVSLAYLELARRWPRRFIVVEGSVSAAEVHRQIVAAFQQRAGGRLGPLLPTRDLAPPGPPVPR